MQLLQLLHPVFDPTARARGVVAAKGLNASPGAASGKVAFTPDEAVSEAGKGNNVILVRHETSPDDIHGMAAANGLLTATGGMTSHAAVVGRQMGKPAVVGCDALRIDLQHKRLRIGEHVVERGDWISIDGTKGDVLVGRVATMHSEVVQVVTGQLKPSLSPTYRAFQRLMDWADLIRRLRVRANADTSDDARIALALGASGIGLARTEHMFFAATIAIPRMQEMILARNEAERRKALKRLLPLQRKDFYRAVQSDGGSAGDDPNPGPASARVRAECDPSSRSRSRR